MSGPMKSHGELPPLEIQSCEDDRLLEADGAFSDSSPTLRLFRSHRVLIAMAASLLLLSVSLFYGPPTTTISHRNLLVPSTRAIVIDSDLSAMHPSHSFVSLGVRLERPAGRVDSTRLFLSLFPLSGDPGAGSKRFEHSISQLDFSEEVRLFESFVVNFSRVQAQIVFPSSLPETNFSVVWRFGNPDTFRMLARSRALLLLSGIPIFFRYMNVIVVVGFRGLQFPQKLTAGLLVAAVLYLNPFFAIFDCPVVQSLFAWFAGLFALSMLGSFTKGGRIIPIVLFAVACMTEVQPARPAFCFFPAARAGRRRAAVAAVHIVLLVAFAIVARSHIPPSFERRWHFWAVANGVAAAAVVGYAVAGRIITTHRNAAYAALPPVAALLYTVVFAFGNSDAAFDEAQKAGGKIASFEENPLGIEEIDGGDLDQQL